MCIGVLVLLKPFVSMYQRPSLSVVGSETNSTVSPMYERTGAVSSAAGRELALFPLFHKSRT